MKKKILILPFIIMPILIPIYTFADQNFLVDIFGCGCSPSPNANDLRSVVFIILTILLSALGIFTSRSLNNKTSKILYCVIVILFNLLLALWVIKTFMWN